MAFDHRKLFDDDSNKYCTSISSLCPPPTHHRRIPTAVIIIVAILSATLLLAFVKYCSNRNASRRRRPLLPAPQSQNTQIDFLDEDHGPVVDHHVWLISTVGLNQSIIDSITICKYNKEEGLVEGTECSVCLNEFQEEDTLRLLPKCSHAFHPPCIDTWLRSHTNCPLCRAPIITSSSGSGEEESLVGNSENDGGLGNNDVREDGVSDLRIGTEDIEELQVQDGRTDSEIAKDGLTSSLENCEFKVFDNLSDYNPVVEGEMQPVRRSVSLDSSSASMICFALANFLPVEPEGSSASQLISAEGTNFHEKVILMHWKVLVCQKQRNPNLKSSRVKLLSFLLFLISVEFDIVVGSALVDLYGKCGDIYGYSIKKGFKVELMEDKLSDFRVEFKGPPNRLEHVLELVIPQLLLQPNPDDPYNTDAADLLTRSKEEYEEKVQEKMPEQSNGIMSINVAIAGYGNGNSSVAEKMLVFLVLNFFLVICISLKRVGI
ncbi:hypothetical protein HHK36_008140 [Tetracentron sinense]|uniref:RING-type E3 ubiquitin transferase n=1 Tax=Tetracentron sinense TaxID=13715 RepID=A0A834ZIH0_TETSI|nr:hypothetical protein HHK36_008140 [Tetracentron sinense]